MRKTTGNRVGLIERIEAFDARTPFAATVLLTFLGTLLANLPNLSDPIVRHDDLPALLGYAELFYSKTLSEGRWVNYYWHLRPIETPAWLNLLVYHLSAAIICTGLAISALGRQSQIWYRFALALFAWLGAPHYLISLWYNTYILGMALTALYAWLATVSTERQARLLLIPFVPLGLMSYTTYPLFMLAICLVRHDTKRSFLDGLRLMLLFVASFALGLVLAYALNYYEHGIFGIEMATWREGQKPEDLATAIQNLWRMVEFGGFLLNVLGYGMSFLSALHMVLFGLAIYYIAKQDFWRSMYIFVGMLAGLGMLALQAALTGIELPPRIFGFGWLFYAAALVLFVLLIVERGGIYKRHAINALRFLVMLLMMQVFLQHTEHRQWQRDTRALAREIGVGEAPIYVIGIHKDIPSWEAAGIQSAYGLRFRLTYLTGRRAYMCSDVPKFNQPDLCDGFDPLVEDERRLDGKTIIEHLPDRVMVILPRRALGEEEQ